MKFDLLTGELLAIIIKTQYFSRNTASPLTWTLYSTVDRQLYAIREFMRARGVQIFKSVFYITVVNVLYFIALSFNYCTSASQNFDHSFSLLLNTVFCVLFFSNSRMN